MCMLHRMRHSSVVQAVSAPVDDCRLAGGATATLQAVAAADPFAAPPAALTNGRGGSKGGSKDATKKHCSICGGETGMRLPWLLFLLLLFVHSGWWRAQAGSMCALALLNRPKQAPAGCAAVSGRSAKHVALVLWTCRRQGCLGLHRYASEPVCSGY